MGKSVAIYANGIIENIEPKNGTDFKLEELQSVVQGYIEIVWLNDMIMVVDEDGHANQKRLNMFATMLAGQTIVGNVVYCPRTMVK